jgi:N utilization substance protein A
MKRKKNEALKAIDIAASISAVTKEKSISMDLVLETLKDALATAARKYLGLAINVEVKVDREKGLLEVYTRQTVVEVVEDPENQILLEDALDIESDIRVGDELIQELDIDLFGRMAIQTAKQVIIQRVREAERDKIFADYSDRIGELVTGTVQQIEKGNILVNLGRTEALLPYKEQIRKEHYRQGDNIRACISEVKNNPKGPQVIISRTSPDFLARLFELEVPEIFDKTVRIVKVVRDPGHRSKIAVTTSDSRVDPVGACVGMRGNRVQAIVRELSNERIDIINWTDELSLLVRRVFAPAEVKRVIPVGEHKVVIVIREEDLAQAIGREGQNIRLASKMLDKEIDVFGDEEFANMSDEQRNAAMNPVPANPGRSVGGQDGRGRNRVDDIFNTDMLDDEDQSMDENLDQNVLSEDDGSDMSEDPVQNEIISDAIDTMTQTEQDVEEVIEKTEENNNKEGN